MAAGTYDMLLRPFREAVKLGELASAHAQSFPDHENGLPLRSAARSLTNEGERALKKITPTLLSPTAEFSEFLLDLALRQDDIAARFRDLDVLLYDFDDYIEVDSFEKDKFDTLQVAIKDLAIILLDKIRRYTAESSLDEPIPPIAFFPLPPLPNAERSGNAQATRRPVSRQRIAAAPSAVHEDGPEPPRRTSHPIENQSRHYSGPYSPAARQYNRGPASLQRPVAFERSMSMPVGDAGMPAAIGHPTQTLHTAMEQLDVRAGIATSHRPLSPDSPRSPHLSASSSFSPVYYRSSVSTSVPEEVDYYEDEGEWSPSLTKTMQSVAISTIADHEGPPSRQPSDGAPKLSPDVYRRVRQDSLMGGVRGSRYIDESNMGAALEPTVSNVEATSSTLVSSGASASAPSSNGKTEDGQRMSLRSRSSTKARRASAGSLGPESSFGMNKGFCKGAQKFMSDGPGGAVKKVGGSVQSQMAPDNKGYAPELHFNQMFQTPGVYADAMAQCSHCEYKTIYSQLLQDMRQDPLANQQAQGVHYRSRFLYKSHITTRDMSNTYFACVFCAQMGATCRDGDATVFQSVSLLFRHLNRHPLPLPHVPGITVLYDSVDPNQAGAQDYDLHFPNPSANLELAASLDEADDETPDAIVLPTARATKDHIHRRNEKPLSRPSPLDGAKSPEVLQFLAGAKIIKVEFPDKWEGKWCRGWHDGMFGTFPSKMVELETPRGLDVNALPRSARSATARWKCESKGLSSSSSPWLKFGRGERITNIAWDDPRAWYWSGTNIKGKSGIFPKTHIKIESVKDGSQVEDTPKPAPSGRSGFSSLFSRG